jgi:hypothetical protein
VTPDDAEVVVPAPRSDWRRIVAADPYALVSQTPQWVDAICATRKYEDVSRMYVRNGRTFVLPLVRRIGASGAFAVDASNPTYWGVGGIVAPGGPHSDDVATLFRQMSRERALRHSLVPNPLLACVWAQAAPSGAIVRRRRAHVVDLEDGFDRVWGRFRGAARTGARRAEREGVRVECDAAGRFIPALYELLERSTLRWARQQHEPRLLAQMRFRRRDPLSKLRAIARVLGDECRIWLATVDGVPAAALMVLQGGNASYIRGAMDERMAQLRANDLLFRYAIEDACRANCRWFQMGESGASASLARFKERFGARPYDYAEYRLESVPLTTVETAIKTTVKRAIGFVDA